MPKKLTATEIQPPNPFRAVIPEGMTFGTIYADPPWPADKPGTESSRRRLHYDRMSANEIMDMGDLIKSITTDDAHLWLWTTNPHLEIALKTVKEWGFNFKTMATWTKTKLGQGWWLRSRTEHLIFAAKSNEMRHNPGTWDTTIKGAWRGHSVKPPVHDRIEALSPGKYLELFSRSNEKRKGWTCVTSDSTPTDAFGQQFKHKGAVPDANDGVVRGVGGLEIIPGQSYIRLEKMFVARPVIAHAQKGRRVQIEIDGKKHWYSIDTLRPADYTVPA